MEWGMKNRLAQLIKPDGHCLFLPIDHGYFQGPTRNWRTRRNHPTLATLL